MNSRACQQLGPALLLLPPPPCRLPLHLCRFAVRLSQVFREIKFFGDSEIATLKKELEAHKLQLEQLKSARAERARREEALVGGRCIGGPIGGAC